MRSLRISSSTGSSPIGAKQEITLENDMNDNVIELKNQTYEMRLACMNCFQEWIAAIPRGTLVRTWKGTCQNCGCREFHAMPRQVGSLAQPYLSPAQALLSERELMLRKIEDEARRQIAEQRAKDATLEPKPLPDPLS